MFHGKYFSRLHESHQVLDNETKKALYLQTFSICFGEEFLQIISKIIHRKI